jgi:hypothetical protein
MNMKKLGLIFIFMFAAIAGYAQKLPKVQNESVWVPANIKIDGTAAEWNYKYKAFDLRNHIFYTISNDDKNLYLIIHTAEQHTINKIYVGGVTFKVISVNHPHATPVAISYPYRFGNNGIYLHAKNEFDKLKKDSIANGQKIRDLLQLKNKDFTTMWKELKAAGIKALNDTVFAVYDAGGIKVKTLFDNQLDYTYELALPLKYLETVLNNSDKLRFDIRLNGGELDNGRMRPSWRFIGPDGSEVVDMNVLYTHDPTDFGGVYTLAKKQ